jgi:hypothetical protein
LHIGNKYEWKTLASSENEIALDWILVQIEIDLKGQSYLEWNRPGEGVGADPSIAV